MLSRRTLFRLVTGVGASAVVPSAATAAAGEQLPALCYVKRHDVLQLVALIDAIGRGRDPRAAAVKPLLDLDVALHVTLQPLDDDDRALIARHVEHFTQLLEQLAKGKPRK